MYLCMLVGVSDRTRGAISSHQGISCVASASSSTPSRSTTAHSSRASPRTAPSATGLNAAYAAPLSPQIQRSEEQNGEARWKWRRSRPGLWSRSILVCWMGLFGILGLQTNFELVSLQRSLVPQRSEASRGEVRPGGVESGGSTRRVRQRRWWLPQWHTTGPHSGQKARPACEKAGDLEAKSLDPQKSLWVFLGFGDSRVGDVLGWVIGVASRGLLQPSRVPQCELGCLFAGRWFPYGMPPSAQCVYHAVGWWLLAQGNRNGFADGKNSLPSIRRTSSRSSHARKRRFWQIWNAWKPRR